MVYKYIGTASQQPFPDNNTWPKKLDTTDIGDLNLAHLRAPPIIQKPLVDTEQLDPDIPREMLEPLKSRLPPLPLGLQSCTSATLIAFVNTGKIIFSCLGLCWADFAFHQTLAVLYQPWLEWFGLDLDSEASCTYCSKQNLIKIFTSIIWSKTFLKLTKANCSARLLQKALEHGRAVKKKGCSWEEEATCCLDVVKSIYNIY